MHDGLSCHSPVVYANVISVRFEFFIKCSFGFVKGSQNPIAYCFISFKDRRNMFLGNYESMSPGNWECIPEHNHVIIFKDDAVFLNFTKRAISFPIFTHLNPFEQLRLAGGPGLYLDIPVSP